MKIIPADLLTRQWRDTPQGIELVFWVNTDTGPARILIQNQEAVCFIARSTQLHGMNIPCRRRQLELKTLHNQAADALYFRQQSNLNRFRETAKRENLELGESDIKPADRYLMERFITRSLSIEGDAEQRDGYVEFINPRLQTLEREPTLKRVSLDIETDGLKGPLFSIAVSTDSVERVFLRALEQPKSDLCIHIYPDEKTLLQAFFRWLRTFDPDIIMGWSVINFDLDYLEKRCKTLGTPFDMGRGKERSTILQPRSDAQAKVARIPGRVVLDGIDLLRAAFWSFESFALGNVAHALLGKEKLIEQHGEAKVVEIRRQYHEDPAALAAYNLEDCRLVMEIFDHADLIPFALQRARMTGLPMDRQGGSVAAFDNLYLPKLHRMGFVGPDVGSQRNQTSSPGGYVMNSLPGFYDNVLVLDFKSLYPSIIRTFLIDPAGLADPGEDPVPGFLEAKFSRKNNILPKIIKALWNERDVAKKAHNAPLSQAVKIIMNSFYGVLGSSGCRFFDPRLASSITRRGHEIIQRSKEWIEEHGYQVIYGDTDSVFVLLGPDHDEAASSVIGKQLAQGLNLWWTAHLRDEYALPCHLEIEFETHYLRFLMPTIRGSETGSKKRYAGSIRKGEHIVMQFKGLETVRTDWTPLARDLQRELYHRIFFNQPWQDYLRETVADLYAGKLDHKLVYKKRLRRKLEDYTKNVPPHVQAARKLDYADNQIEYLITPQGPEPLALFKQSNTLRPDYEHYLDKQLAPVADGILYFLKTRFEDVTGQQTSLF